MVEEGISASQNRPLIWALLGRARGDNGQILEVCRNLEAETCVFQLAFNRFHVVPNGLLGATALSLSRVSAGNLGPPWPDLVVSAGRRAVPVARWIKAQSGGKAKLIHIGRPRVALKHFDLVITSPQYGLPEESNVVELPLPLGAARLVEASDKLHWLRLWKDLPRPWIGLLVGARGSTLRFNVDDRRQLGELASDLAHRQNGSLVVMASPRTEQAALGDIAAQIRVPFRSYPWGEGLPNPYSASLALCDSFVVTSDSASMMSEALETGKPVKLFRLPDSWSFLQWQAKSGLGRVLHNLGLLRPPRTLSRISRSLEERQLVNILGEPEKPCLPYLDERERALQRARALLSNQMSAASEHSAAQ